MKKLKRSGLLIAALFSLAVLITPRTVMAAVTRIVTQDQTQCPSDTVNFPCYGNISDAIASAGANDAIEIKRGTYVGSFTISAIQGVSSISGDDTADTILASSGSGAALTINGITNSISIRRLTFTNSGTGILVQNSPYVTIQNNIFEVGQSNTAVQLQNSLNANITNNIFYQNANGILSDQVAVNIVNNIFSSQFTTAISQAVTLSGILSNLFYNCTTIGPAISFDSNDTVNYNGNLENVDPMFVDVAAPDFHLQTGSPCINTGNTSRASAGNNILGDTTKADMGAYGGPYMDIVPFPVSNLSTATSASAITLRWKPNSSYQVAGYRVYYGGAPGNRSGTGATEGASGFTVTTASATVSGLPTTASAPAAPTLNPPESLNQQLKLSWSAVPSAKRYNVYYGTTNPPSTFADSTTDTSYTLTGLTNGQTYYVAVSAVDQAIYYFSVTALDSSGLTSSTTVTPGVAHESNYSGEVSVSFGSAVEGTLSNVVSDFPETLSPYPALPGGHQGCFIATAAYGHYSDPAVQALREFRDRYLLTNGPGRAFVEWYYRYSPAAAGALNAHPALKPVVRAALLPAVGGACLLTRTSLLFKISLLMVFVCAVLFLCIRKRIIRQLLRTFMVIVLVSFAPAVAQAADPIDEPHWSLEVKGGMFTPALKDWAQYYDKRSMPIFEGSLAFKPIRQIDIGISGGYAQDSGHAFQKGHNTTAGNVTYKVAPINLFILLRGVISENQFLVPYVGGGFTRLYYVEKIEGQDSVSGSVDGYHFRGGLQILLDGMDERAANRMYMDYGIYQTYFFVEAERTHAVVKSVSTNLGGTAYQAGLLFEF